MYKFILPLFFLLCAHLVVGQSFSGTGGAIPDDGNSVTFEIAVSGLPNAINPDFFGIESVCINLVHTWTADINLTLIAPDGTLISLVNGVGGDTDGFINTCLSGNAPNSIFSGGYPFTGTFRPFGDMGILNNGLNPNGTWKLLVLDTYPFADAGDLLNWHLNFGNNPCQPFVFESSDLPIIKIYTNGQSIVNDPKITAEMLVIDNGNGQRNFVDQTIAAFSGRIGIELRGNSSQGMPKKPYSVEIQDSTGADLAVSILGLPPESDFVLQANFSDKTQVRNAFAFETFRKMGHYASRTRFCELILDGSYQGIYGFTEDIKRGKNRVDIAKLTPQDVSGAALTGGYMLRIDWDRTPGWESQFDIPNSPGIKTKFQHLYPKWDEIQIEQQDYIRAYVDSFEVALAGNNYQNATDGWRRFANEQSFLDYLILNEISRNVDGYRLSTYFFKDRDDKGGKLTMGPPWDYDLAWYNADYCDGFLTAGWAYNLNYVCPGGEKNIPFWWERLVSDTLFAQNLACRWQSLRNGQLSKENIKLGIDSLANQLLEAQARNFELWPILGIYVWPNPGQLPTTYSGEVQKMKNWLYQRTAWMDGALGQNLPTINANFSNSAANNPNMQFSPAVTYPGYTYHWDFGDGAVSDLAAPSHAFSGLGNYMVRLEITTPYGCSAITERVIQIVSANDELTLSEAGISVYPNPAHDVLWIKIEAPEQHDWQVQLRNSIGQVVLSDQIKAHTSQRPLRLQHLPAGVYLLEMTGEKGKVSARVGVE